MATSGSWAVVTGASGGLGAALARELAKRGYNLVLSARRQEAMDTLAAELRTAHGIATRVIVADLADRASVTALAADIADLDVEVLANNAGYGLHGDFMDMQPDAVTAMLEVDVIAPTLLTRLLAERMVARGGGRILLVASLTAFQPIPSYAAYAAAKAYVRSFGEALHVEFAPRKVHVTVLSPGLMDTGFLSTAGQESSASLRRMMSPVAGTAKLGVDALFKGRASVIAGMANRVIALANRFTPRMVQAKVAGRMMR
ncbi:hypothetical protein SAMN05192583_3477 [Sphingomonas gellani]|uniref:Ketoreductase domain-containing protein n=1 Tax=Sphingomonas gellani TaxID=1166340 RepID=A0A1H8J5L0_9SPHN|nr:SDR family NAD(P)-dependent oxidoreductase [Sphingomonas gellani]SEN75596.1 hypothetical protein SAMN05192583_3477 [Sphingomonas gellani]